MAAVTGIDSLIRKLNEIGGNSTAVLEKSIAECAVFVRDDARLNCPVDTGELRRSIDCKTETSKGEVTGTIFTNMHYAQHVEYGTIKQKSQPYLYPAINDNAKQICTKVANDLKSAIAEIARK